MTTLASSSYRSTSHGWLGSAQAWLDSKGRGAWIAAMVLGFIVFWPVGLALLGYMIWSNRMFNSSCGKRRSFTGVMPSRSTGNSAFDTYKADTLRRLEEEQHEFESFLARLREAKDKAEFDQFMNERAAKSDGDAPKAD